MIDNSGDIPTLDSQLVQQDETLRADLAAMGRSDLYFFNKAVLGHKDMTPEFHGHACAWFDLNPSRFKLALWPRGTLKTSSLTIGRNLQRVVRDPESRTLLLNETTTNAERFLSSIRSHADSNPVFRTLYPEVIPRDTKRIRWSASELDFRRQGHYPEPTIDTGGMTGALTSRHFTHICIDDPISEEAAKSEVVMTDAITRIDKIISLMVNTETDTFDLIGTRWAFYDVYSVFMENYGPKLARYIRAAVEDDGLLWPHRLGAETLAQARANMGEYAFSCLYLNNPRNSDVQDFNTQDLRFYRWLPDGKKIALLDKEGKPTRVVHLDRLDITVTVDLAAAEKITSDRNAIVTCGVTPEGDVLVLDVFARRCTPLEVIEHLFTIDAKFGVRVVGIEGVAYQKAFKYFLKAECARRGVYMNIRELTASGKKERRIRGLQPVAATNHLFIDPTQHVLRNEMSEFPLGKHDDTIDALAMQLQLWRGVVSAGRWERAEAEAKKLLKRIRGYSFRDEEGGEEMDEEDLRDSQPQEHFTFK